MADHAAAFAFKLGVDHVTARIQWGRDGTPPRPTKAFERPARDARYKLLLGSMLETGSRVLALGHHLDDQVETSLMRLGRGSTLLGARGMRPLSPFGMSAALGGEYTDAQVLRTLDMWRSRPLLTVGKNFGNLRS